MLEVSPKTNPELSIIQSVKNTAQGWIKGRAFTDLKNVIGIKNYQEMMKSFKEKQYLNGIDHFILGSVKLGASCAVTCAITYYISSKIWDFAATCVSHPYILDAYCACNNTENNEQSLDCRIEESHCLRDILKNNLDRVGFWCHQSNLFFDYKTTATCQKYKEFFNFEPFID